jgi:hypothetical protein
MHIFLELIQKDIGIIKEPHIHWSFLIEHNGLAKLVSYVLNL